MGLTKELAFVLGMSSPMADLILSQRKVVLIALLMGLLIDLVFVMGVPILTGLLTRKEIQKA